MEEAIKLFNEYKLDEARVEFENILEHDKKNVDVLNYLGKIHQRTQNYGPAMNYYQQTLEIDPENENAKTGLQLIKNILQLTNNFYFENAYTDDDLYDFD